MSDTENPSDESQIKTKPLFGAKQEDKPLHNLGNNLINDSEYRAEAGMEPLPEETVNVNEVDNTMTEMNEVASEAVVETPVDGSQADLVNEVSGRLQEEVAGTEAAPETVQEEAPVAVATEVAAAAAADQAATAMAPVSDTGESIEDLRAKQDSINRQIAEKSAAERGAVINQIKSVVETYNIPVAELVEALGGLKNKRNGSKAKAKYRDPVSGTEWSGRGREPLWIKGQDRTKFTITE